MVLNKLTKHKNCFMIVNVFSSYKLKVIKYYVTSYNVSFIFKNNFSMSISSITSYYVNYYYLVLKN